MIIKLYTNAISKRVEFQVNKSLPEKDTLLPNVEINKGQSTKIQLKSGSNKNKKISIIIPLFNVQDYISTCLNSIIGQSYWNLEIIVVDDASTDNTVEIVKNVAMYDKRIQLITLPQNNGPSFARQKGIDISSGDLITFVDADDWYCSSEAIEKLVYTAEKTDADCIIYGYRVVHNHGIRIKKRFNEKEKMYSVQETAIKKITQPSPYWHYLWNKCYKGSVIRENNISFCGKLRGAEDVRFNADFMRYAKNFYILPNNYLYDYNCTNLNQITRKSNIGTLQSELRSFENLKEELHRLSNDFEFIGVYNQCIIPLYKQFLPIQFSFLNQIILV